MIRQIPIPLRVGVPSISTDVEDLGLVTPILPDDNARNILSFATADNGIGTNASYDFYTVPANKVFIVTSCVCHENTTTATNIQFVSLNENGGAGKVANAYLYGGESKELISVPIPFAAGTTVRLKTGGAATSTIAQLQGYLANPSTAAAPDTGEISTPDIG
jgi:hypothetical protein